MTGHRGGASLALGLVLLAVVLVLANVISRRHYVRADWTRAATHALSPKTIAAVRALRRDVGATVLMTAPGLYDDSPYHATLELLRRIAKHSPRFKIERVDMDTDPTRAAFVAKQHRVHARELREGVVVIASGKRSRAIPSRSLAEYEVSPQQGKRLTAFTGEREVLSALLSVSRTDPTTVCFTRGHGEAPTDTYAEAGYGYFFDEVRRDDFRCRVIDGDALVEGAVGCGVVLVGGASRAFAPVELDGLDRFLRRGGRLLVLLGPVLDRRVTRFGRVGIEALLRKWGAGLSSDIVVDRVSVPGEQPLMTWATRQGYTDHPIARSMAGRLTIWPLTRRVEPLPDEARGVVATTLVRTSEAGWAETNLASLRGARPLAIDAGLDTRGPVSVAVAARRGKARVVVIGTERGVLNRRLGSDRVTDFNADFVLAALGWLSGRDALVAVGPKVAERVRIVHDERQVTLVGLITIVALPLFMLCGGALVAWRRRR